jgi:alpha-ketoglutarate-dependent taurine dioxygenase
MIDIQAIEFPGFENVFENIEFYKEKFIKDSVIVFRNANLTLDEQNKFHQKLGEHFGWHTSTEEKNYYQESHHHNKNIGIAKKDEVMLGWHVEHCYYSNPIVAGTWNMFHLTADPESGKTYFVDTCLIYEMLDEDSQKFISSCTVNCKNYGVETEKIFAPYSAVKEHWLTNKPTIRIPISSNWQTEKPGDEYQTTDGEFLSDPNILELVDGRTPTDSDYKKFADIAEQVSAIIKTEESIRLVQKWKQGDLVFMDAFKLAHAVTGGFKPEDRKFTGIWGQQNELQYKQNN